MSQVNKRTLSDLHKMVPGSITDDGADIAVRYSTTIPPLDVILTGEVGKGFPSGRVIELYGEESVGKTTLCATLIAAIQRDYHGAAILWDTEATMTSDRVRYMGINSDDLIYGSSHFCEDVMQEMVEVTRKIESGASNPFGIMVWDTVAGTEAKMEHGKKVGESGTFSPHARILSEGFRKLCKPLARTKFAAIFCNQLKTGGIGQMYAREREKEATLGGKAMRFHAHLRIKMTMKRKYITKIDNKVTYVGDEIHVTKIKDKEGGSGVAGTDCILVIKKSGDGAGKFSNALSCLKTLQHWGLFKKDSITVDGKKYTDSSFEKKYEKDQAFRDLIHKKLTIMRRLKLRLSEKQVAPEQPQVLPEEDD